MTGADSGPATSSTPMNLSGIVTPRLWLLWARITSIGSKNSAAHRNSLTYVR